MSYGPRPRLPVFGGAGKVLLGPAEYLSVPRLGIIAKGGPGIVVYVCVCVNKCACAHMCVCMCTHVVCGPRWGPAACPAENKCLGALHGHQLGHQLVRGSAWFLCALLGSPRGWTHGPSAIRAQASLAMENFGSGCRGSREGPPCVGIMVTQACPQTPPVDQENTLAP